MVPQYSARFTQRPQDLERVLFGVGYIEDTFAVEFWVDVYDRATDETVIVTGRYCEIFGEPEYVWLDYESLHLSHPLWRLVAQDRELMAACEREYQRARFRALDAIASWTA